MKLNYAGKINGNEIKFKSEVRVAAATARSVDRQKAVAPDNPPHIGTQVLILALGCELCIMPCGYWLRW